MAEIPVVDPFSAQAKLADTLFGGKGRSRKAEAAMATRQGILADPLYQKYVEMGRIEPIGGWIEGGDKKAVWNNQNNGAVMEAIKKAQEQDKQIGNYYELATGRKADQATIDSFSQYAQDPALLQAAIAQSAAKAGPVGTYGESINAAIKEKLGRDATEAEKTYFGKQMEQGGVDLYGLNTFLEGTPEYQTKTSDVARGKLATELQGVDQAYLDKVSKQLQAQYSAQGRQGAGAFGSALIGAGKDIATQRTGYLADLGYQDFQRGQQNLRADYEAQLARQYAGQQAGSALGQESRARYYGQQDFDRQQAAQERLMRLQRSMQPSSGSFLQNLVPGLISSGAQVFAAKMGQPTSNQYYGSYPQDNYVMRRNY